MNINDHACLCVGDFEKKKKEDLKVQNLLNISNRQILLILHYFSNSFITINKLFY